MLYRAATNAASLAGRAAGAVSHTAGRAALAGLEAALASPYTDEALDQIARRIERGPELERIAERLLAGPLLDKAIDRLLESEELWVLIDQVAQSPAVTDAIGQQGAGLADQVAGEVRARSERADARVERIARRLLRRGVIPPGPSVEPHTP